MALHVKSTKTFKFLIGGSAVLISAMAATFSITGIASLFSGYFFTVALMMGALEFSKIVVASYLSRYWNEVTSLLKTYFILALLILILITSGGIFGYLSDAYQKTKGDYSIVEKQTEILKVKQNAFIERKNRLLEDRKLQLSSKKSTQIRIDSLTVRGQNINRARIDITDIDNSISQLDKQISISEDSISYYDVKILELESKNIQGELGPLKYIAGIFDTNMDVVVKYFIFLLIFVFDPLAILLFVSLNSLIKNESAENNIPTESTDVKLKNEIDENTIFDSNDTKYDPIIQSLDTTESNATPDFMDEIENKNNTTVENDDSDAVNLYKQEKDLEENKNEIKIEDDFVNTLVEEFSKNLNSDKEHEFYHKDQVSSPPVITRKSSNYHAI